MTISGTYNQGFIGSVANCALTIKDLTFENAKLTDVNNFSGVVIGYQYGDVTLDNVDVVNAQINTKEIDKGNNEYDRGIRVGGLVGFSPMNENGVKLTLTNCDVSGTKISAWHNVGGLVGTMQDFMINTSKWNVTNCTVTNCELTLLTPTAKSTYANAFAASGEYSRTVPAYNKVFTDKGNTATDVTVKIRDGFAYVANLSKTNGDQSHYEISTPDGLKYFRDSVNGGTSYQGETVKLMNDINLSNESWTPIGMSGKTFQGIFDGNGKTVSNLKVEMSGKDDAGLFGYVTDPGEIKNLTVNNATVEGRTAVAALVGNGYNMKAITDCKVTGTISISGNYKVGGLVGQTYGTITNCSVTGNSAAPGTITGVYSATDLEGDNVGGMIGFYGEGANVISDCHVSYVTVSGSRKVGGVIGYLNYGNTITRSSFKNGTVKLALVDLDGESDYLGDKTGNNNFTDAAGGVVGVVHNESNKGTCTITNCTADTVKLVNETENGDAKLGDIYGALRYGTSGTALTDSDNRANNMSVDQPAGTAAQLSALLRQASVGGEGNVTVTLTKDFDLTNQEWEVFKPQNYSGANTLTINGNGYSIKGLTKPLMMGAFGGNDGGIVIKDLTIVDANINCTRFNGLGVGAFVAYMDSVDKLELVNCHLKNSTVICTDGYAGGLVGYSSSPVTITNCSVVYDSTLEGSTNNETKIQGSSSTGGLIGQAAAASTISGCTVKNCSISSQDDGGWRVGVIGGTFNAESSTITGTTHSGNTLSQKDQTAPTDTVRMQYGRIVQPGGEQTITLTIDGTAYAS